MSDAVEKLKPELVRLTEDERADLAHFLLSSLDDTDADSSDFAETLDRRSEELKSGAVAGIPSEEVLERLRAKYP
jgi:putative addiction module component (TIGR02574 family)